MSSSLTPTHNHPQHTHTHTHTHREALGSGDGPGECWVTVFGFPPSASSYVLEQFSQYGTILRHSVSLLLLLITTPHVVSHTVDGMLIIALHTSFSQLHMEFKSEQLCNRNGHYHRLRVCLCTKNKKQHL